MDQGGNPVIAGNFGNAILAKLAGSTNDLLFLIRVATTTTQPTVNAVALDGEGQIFVTGQVKEETLPTEAGLQPSCARFSQSECSRGAFLLRFAADGSSITYGTFLGGSAANGGSGSDQGTGIAVGADGSVYTSLQSILHPSPLSCCCSSVMQSAPLASLTGRAHHQ